MSSGCSSLSEKFLSSEKVNMEPFATQTFKILNTIDYGLERDESLLTQHYIRDKNNVELAKLIELDDELYHILRVILAYSIKVVRLSKSSRTNAEKVKEFTDYIDNLEKPALAYHIKNGSITEKEFNDILITMRSKEELLDAMQAAQPMIQFILSHLDAVIKEIKQQELKATTAIEQAIDKDFFMQRGYLAMLENRRNLLIDGLVLIDKYYQGKKKSLSRLNRKNLHHRFGLTKQKVDGKNIRKTEIDLRQLLAETQQQLKILESDGELYNSIQQELDLLIKFHRSEVQKTKGIIQLWSNAHKLMTSGVTDSADWFDLSDPASGLFDLTKVLIKR